MEKISACLIVKNEAKNIVRCVEELRKFCDEIVVVDTGSMDDTKRLASEWNCKVYDFKWIDDYSAARNFSIEKASNDWVYWHDGDDSINDGNIEEIKKLDFDGYDAVYFDVRSLGEKGKIRWVNSRVRMFKKSTGMKFIKPIHEDVNYVENIKYGNPGIYVNHLGYMDAEEIQRKSSRNMKVLENQKGKFKEAGYYIANEYMLKRELVKAEKEFQDFLASTEDGSCMSLRVNTFLKLAVINMGTKNKEAARIHLFNAIAFDGERPEPYLFLGDLEDDKEKALEHYEKSLDKAQMPGFMPVTLDVAFYTYLPYMRLGDACFDLKNYEDALGYYKAALTFNREFTECLIKIKDCHAILAKIYGKRALENLV